jgi:hypothetical protein
MATILGVAAAALVLAPFALAQDASSLDRPALVLTYWEARAAGLPVGPTALELGVPTCPETTTPDPGFRDEQEAEAAMQSPTPTCLSDPTKTIYGYGRGVRSGPAGGFDQASDVMLVARARVAIAAWRLAGSPRLFSVPVRAP